MKIKKCIVLVICLAGLTLSLLPVSFAVSSIVSPMSEPTVDMSSDGGYDVYRFYAEFFSDDYLPPPDRVNSKYSVFSYTVVASSGSTVTARPGKISDLICSGGRLISVSADIFDAVSGNLYRSISFPVKSDGSGTVWAPYFPNLSGSWFYKTDGVSVQGAQVASFIEFSVYPPEHNIYHSQLSEPVSDKYNRYFILDDKLFWVSIRVNGFWLKSADIEGLTGYYQYEALAPQQGGYEFGYQGVLAQYSGFVPVNLNYSGFFNSLPFDLVLLPSSDQWSIGVKSSSIFSDVQSKIDCEFFISEFDLVDGKYLSSSFVSFQRDNLSSASFPLSESGSFSDVRCYGVDFYNADNIPVNLSDVLWEYDLDFVLWRDDMFQRLTDIFNLLSEAESVTSYQAPDLASKMDDENIINDLSYNSGDVQQDLNLNIDRGIQALGSDGGVLQSLSSQIIGLGNGKIFSLLIISLSLGILILMLGKNKND